ncbi:MAG: SMC family ATPase [Propionibacteriales bacterium]|nr:SMC family ATPase [Propionibacteriales bacterium]
MRLHQLSITAFGPFAEQVTVDFDALSEAGLFLLTGATGAGKTSVLDAVCFALYGQVPGDRAGAKHLRSDHAPADLAPEVVLRLGVGEREFRFSRSPAWMRPKLRGRGETKVQAHVLVEELVDGRWSVLTNRLDDAGLLVTDLLGMSSTQFTQVAMLPQGRFQAFLRATSAERHSVLQQLFRTDRFERIEAWMVERRTRSRRASEAAGDEVLEIVNRFQEASGTDLEPAWIDDLATASASGDLERWALQLSSAAAVDEAAAVAAAASADHLQTTAAERLAAGVRTTELRTRAAAAAAVLDAGAHRAADLDAARRRLADHQRAVPLTELAAAQRTARHAADRAAERWAARSELLGPLLPIDFGRDDLASAQRAARDAHTLAVGFAPREAAHRAARAELGAIQTQLQSLEAGVAELELILKEIPGVITDAVAAVHEARAAAARHPIVAARADRLEILLAAARRAELISLEIVAARTDVLAATEAAQSAKENYLDLREARINGMAGELAGKLASGCFCPVCGSASHPAPAERSANSVGRADEDQARKVLDDAEFFLQTQQVGLATLEGELSHLDQQLAGTVRDGLAAGLAAARDEAERLEPLVAALDVLVGREADCRQEQQRAEADLRTALLDRARLRGQADQQVATITVIDEEWDRLLSVPGAGADEDPAMGLSSLVDLRRRRADLLEVALTDLDACAAAAAQADDLTHQVARAAVDAGFAGAESALSALLDDEQHLALQVEVREAEEANRAAAATLAEPAVVAALAGSAPALDQLRTDHQAAAAAGRRAVAALAAASTRRARLGELSQELKARVDAWTPLQDEYRTVADLTSFVEGKSVDNVQRMRLAAYVLAERLRQVVDAANERLVAMTDQRYALEHTDDRGYGEQRGGLSLRVRDDWNGVHRDPATLSGGETFVVSLALALGLADTVAHEAGGTDIDTLFIDEGFGSLDADTLEDVMDTLDSLRDGGRVVGLVSHVPELRSRITTQLEVTKGRSGSQVRTTVSPG